MNHKPKGEKQKHAKYKVNNNNNNKVGFQCTLIITIPKENPSWVNKHPTLETMDLKVSLGPRAKLSVAKIPNSSWLVLNIFQYHACPLLPKSTSLDSFKFKHFLGCISSLMPPFYVRASKPMTNQNREFWIEEKSHFKGSSSLYTRLKDQVTRQI
jgi:hypothetical protein